MNTPDRTGVVESVSPLSVRFPLDANPTPIHVSLVPLGSIAVGDSAYCRFNGTQLVLLGIVQPIA